MVSISSPPETPLFMGISGLQVKSEEFQFMAQHFAALSFSMAKLILPFTDSKFSPPPSRYFSEIREETRGLRGKVWGKKRKNKRISLHNPKINLTFVANSIPTIMSLMTATPGL